MRIAIEEVSAAFDDLVSARKSREQISSWANALREADDYRTLEFETQSDRHVIMEAIIYLGAVDLKVSPENYLYSIEDFTAFRRQPGV